MDCAQKQIEELRGLNLTDTDDCTIAFCSAYSSGDSVEAYVNVMNQTTLFTIRPETEVKDE